MHEKDVADSFRQVYKTFGTRGPTAEPSRRTYFPPSSTSIDERGRVFTTSADYLVRSNAFTEEQLAYVMQSMSSLSDLVLGNQSDAERQVTYPSLSQRIENTFGQRMQSQGDPRFGTVVIDSLFATLHEFQTTYPDMIPALYITFKQGGYHSLNHAPISSGKAEFPLYLQYALNGDLTEETTRVYRLKFPRIAFVGAHGEAGGQAHFGSRMITEDQCPAHFFVGHIINEELQTALHLATSPEVRERYKVDPKEEYKVLDNFPQGLEAHMKKLMAKSLRQFLTGDKDWDLMTGRIYPDVFMYLKVEEES